MTLRDQIIAAMQAQGIHAAELARRSGVHKATLSRFLTGRRDMYASSVDKLLAVLKPGESVK